MNNLYEILGVTKEATLKEIKKAFRTLSKKHHPDSGIEPDATLFQAIKEAYDVLINPEAREHYNEKGYPPGKKKQNLSQAERHLMDMFAGMVEDILSNCDAPYWSTHGEDATRVDVVSNLTSKLNNIRQRDKASLKKHNKVMKFLDKMLERAKGECPRLVLLAKKEHLEGNIKTLEVNLKILDECDELLQSGEWEYLFEDEQALPDNSRFLSLRDIVRDSTF